MIEQSSITREALVAFLKQFQLAQKDLDLLRWLIWFPLLSTVELARLLGQRPKYVAALLKKWEERGLFEHIVLAEPGVAPHHRYYVADLGLYTFAAIADPPLSVPRLVSAYAVDRTDLLARLVRPDLLRTLADISTRLVSEGKPLGYILSSYQQPWVQTDHLFGTRQTIRYDAALLIAHPSGSEYAWYLHIDSIESRLFQEKKERIQLDRVLTLRNALLLQREHVPHLLIVTRLSRLLSWAQLIEKLCEDRNTALLDGGITFVEKLNEGIYTPIWWSFSALIHWKNAGCITPLPQSPVSLPSLFGSPISRQLAERFSQRATFAHLLTERNSGPFRRTKKAFPLAVGNPPLYVEALTAQKETLTHLFSGNQSDQRTASAWLSMILSGPQKELLSWLTHHPLLSIEHLATLLVPTSLDIRVVRRHMVDLQQLGLLVPFPWRDGATWQARERYLLSETALKYTALRDGLPATSHLKASEKRTYTGPLHIQKNAGWLFHLMAHTEGVYSCICHIFQRAHHDKARIIIWKSEFEAVQGYWHPFWEKHFQIRPDAELLYLPSQETIPIRLWVEYDRGTTFAREQRGKYDDYDDYREFSQKMIPPILLVTKRAAHDRLIQQVLRALRHQFRIIVVQERDLREQSLLGLLQRPG